jgi:PAS domain S-box-containing protein
MVPLRLLLLEDRPSDADLLISELRRAGVQTEVKLVATRASYLERLDSSFDAIISDYNLPQFNAKEALALLRATKLDIPFIVVSGTMGEETAVELMKLGATDYLLKDRLGRLPQALLRAVGAMALRRENDAIEKALRLNALETGEILRRQDEQYRQLFEKNPSPMWVYDEKTLQILAANDAASLLYGYSVAEFLTLTLSDMRPSEDIPKLVEAVSPDGVGSRLPGVWRHVRKDRSLLWAEVCSSPVVFQGTPARLAIIIDVTARLAAEEKVRRSEANLVLAQRIGHFGSWQHALTTEGKMEESTLRSSVEMYRIFGIQPSLLRSDASLFDGALHPDDRTRVEAARAETLRSGNPYDIEHRIVLGNGAERIVNVRAELFRHNGEGGPDKILGTTQDITERKLAETALNEAKEKYRTIFENASDGIFQTSLEGRILVANPAAARILGFESPDELIRSRLDVSCQGYVDPQRRQQFNELIEKNGSVRGFESEVYRKDGSTICISENARIVRDAAGEVLCFEGTFEDITERKRAERELRLSESRLRAIIDNEPECVKTVSADGLLLEMNRAGLRMIDAQSSAQICGKPVSELIHPEDWARFEELHRRASHGGTGHLQFRLIGLRGTERWADTHSVGLPDGEGGPTSVLSVTRDITTQHLAEAARREADQHLADIINSVEGIVWEADQVTGQFTFVSEKAERILGYPVARWLSEPRFWEKHLHPDDREKAIAFSAAVTAQLAPAELEYRMVSAEGREVWIKDRITVFGPPGRSIKQRGVMLDVTHRKRADMEARAGEARIREQAKLLDLAHDAIMVRDMDDHVEYWNHGAEKLYGWTAAEVQGKQASTFLHEEPPATVLSARLAVTESGKWSGECKHLRKEGGTVMVRSRWTLVRDELGNPKAILIINTDITEQKRVEEQFLRAQRLESIGTLASGVAHDLNNILVPILMAAPLLRGNLPKAEREKFLTIVESSAERGAGIVKQVLTFARGADGDHVLLQPNYLIGEIATIAERTFPKSITVRTRYNENIRPLEADATQLHQVLLNLVINGRDAMPNGGNLTLSVENFDVDDHYASMTPGAKPGPHVLMQVSDTGTGIPRHVVDKIFDPFFTTKDVGLGTGLGLSTALGIVKSHGGFMHVNSEVGHTSFKVFLPAAQGNECSIPTPSPDDIPTGKGQTILVVDDEMGIREVAQAVLVNHGYKVLVAEDGPAALALLARHSGEVELMLTDMVMPFMDGPTLARTVRRMEPDIRVILSTGRDEDSRSTEVAGLQLEGCLTKPYTRGTLLLLLDHVLNPAAGSKCAKRTLSASVERPQPGNPRKPLKRNRLSRNRDRRRK